MGKGERENTKQFKHTLQGPNMEKLFSSLLQATNFVGFYESRHRKEKMLSFKKSLQIATYTEVLLLEAFMKNLRNRCSAACITFLFSRQKEANE
jgi:hypothetical protein